MRDVFPFPLSRREPAWVFDQRFAADRVVAHERGQLVAAVQAGGVADRES